MNDTSRRIVFGGFLAVIVLSHVARADEPPRPGDPSANAIIRQVPAFRNSVLAATLSPDSHLLWAGGTREGVTQADVDADGDIDLIVESDLYLTDGKGLFELIPGAARLGAALAPADDALRSQLQLPEGQGAVVTKLVANMPLAKAGLREDDIIVTASDQPIANAEDLRKVLDSAHGKEVPVQYVRQGQTNAAKIALPPAEVYFRFTLPLEYRIGVAVVPADRTLLAQLKLPAGQGVIVTEVFDNTPAAKAGLQTHDVLLVADEKKLTSLDDLHAVVQQSEGKPMSVSLVRAGKKRTLKVTPEQIGSARMTSGSRPESGPRIWNINTEGTIEELFVPGVSFASPHTTAEPNLATKLDRMLQQIERLRADVEGLRQTLPAADAKKGGDKRK